MPADPFTLRQADQARTDFAIIEDELEAIHKRLSQLPTRNEVWRAAMDQHFPGTAWLRLGQGSFDALYRYRTENAMVSWDEAVTRLLKEADE